MKRGGSNSYVCPFYRDFRTARSQKLYFPRPNLLGTDVGVDTRVVCLFSTHPLAQYAGARVSLVGCSRDGLIAILAARRPQRSTGTTCGRPIGAVDGHRRGEGGPYQFGL